MILKHHCGCITEDKGTHIEFNKKCDDRSSRHFWLVIDKHYEKVHNKEKLDGI